MTAPSFRVLNETLNTRVKKKIERERKREEKRPNAREFFPFSTESEKKKGQPTFVALFLYSFYPASLL